MDISFALQALAIEWLATRDEPLEPAVVPVPEEIDREVAGLKLESLGVAIDELTAEQRAYLSSWLR
jgi:adenosylhomocysteinase